VAFADPGVAVLVDGPDDWMGQVIDVRVDGLHPEGAVGARPATDPAGPADPTGQGASHVAP
jgi:hypothetical protein